MNNPRPFFDFMRERAGLNWVIHARRTAQIVERYGDEVVVITPKRYAQLQAEHAKETAERIGLDPLRAIRLYLEACPDRPIGDFEGYQLAFRRIVAAGVQGEKPCQE